MPEIHIIFGAGPLGRWTANALIGMGKTVRMVNRSGKMVDAPLGVEILASDAYDTARNIEITRGATTIYQCAQPQYHAWAEKFPTLQRTILAAAIANRTKLVVGDNLYMYGRFTGALTEDAPIAPNTKKGRVRAAMAQEILEAHASGKVRVAIGRASDFFGPYDTALTGYAIQPAVQGKTANLMGRTDQTHSFTYIADFGRLLATLGTRPDALGQVWFAPTNPPLTQADFIKLIEAELGRRVKVRVGGPLLLRLLGLVNQDIAETVEMLYEWTAPYRIDSSKAENAFGITPTPLQDAIRDTVRWCLRPNVPSGKLSVISPLH
ncbi:MAG: NAD-dependent epimerase/dehydratase family protein [Anaerolineaceae bacterium]|nr:NAD-dependent epimerase/dehydratase family protein [Anaerolineaceae bacterium]